MQWCKECDCNRKIINFDSIEFKIDGSRTGLDSAQIGKNR